MIFVLVLLGATFGTHRYSADLVELNTVYSPETGKEVLTQVIWWNWDYKKNDYVVRDWRLIAKCSEPYRTKDGFVVRWNDNGTQREVRSKMCKRTHLLYDPEVFNRQKVSECDRNRIR